MAQQKRLNWADNPPTDWGERQAKVIAEEVKRLRDKRSAQWLADRTNELGYEVSRSVISDLENGRRRYVTTAEVTVLAAALNTSPVCLVYPPPYGSQVEALPGIDASKFHAAQWFSALAWLSNSSALGGGDALTDWRASTGELRSYRRLSELEASRGMAMKQSLSETPSAAALSRTQIELYDMMIHEIRQKLGLDTDA